MANLEKGEFVQLDFDALNDALNSAYTCKVEECERGVADKDTFCMGCFAGLLTGEVIRIEGPPVNGPGTRFRHIKNPDFKPKKGRK